MRQVHAEGPTTSTRSAPDDVGSHAQPDGPTAHVHSHGHDAGGWREWRRTRTLQAVLILVAVGALATTIGVVALWPSGEGRDTASAAADEIGLATERLAATVTGVDDGPCSYSTEDRPQQCRVVSFVITEGPDESRVVELPEYNLNFDATTPQLAAGDEIIVGYEDSTDFYFYADRDRRASLGWLAALFAFIVIGFGRFRGLLALAAMAFTLVVLVTFVGPSVLDGNDPVLVCVVAAAAIAFISLYLTHGVTPATTIALAGTLAALALTFGLSWLFFEIASFTGLATEESLILPFVADNVDVSGLLLGGAVIGALGALDDVTVTQVATIAELRRRDPGLSTRALTASGIRIGRDHIASTVNTLLLAYAGASMPLLLLFAVSDQSLVMIANSELVAVEIVRTLCGSIGLIAAVPITTTLAAAVLRPPAGGTEAERLRRREPTRHAASQPAREPQASEPRRRSPRWEDFAPDSEL